MVAATRLADWSCSIALIFPPSIRPSEVNLVAPRLAAKTIAVWPLGGGSAVAQFGALAIVGVYTVAVSLVLAKLCNLVMPMRVDAEAEYNGLDLSAHGERAYDIMS